MAKPSAVPEPPEEGAINRITKNFSLWDLLIFLANEGIGVPLVIAGGEGAANLHWIPALVGFGVGLPLMTAGVVLPLVKHKFDENVRRRLAGIATAMVLAVILASFIYAVGPGIYEHIAPPIPASQGMPAEATPPSRPISPIRVDITGTKVVPPANGQNLFINLNYLNRSISVAARGMISNGTIMMTPKILDAKQEEATEALLLPKLDFPSENITSELPPEGIGFFTVNSDIGPDQLKDIKDGKEVMYLFAHIRYGDALSGLMTETQYCSYWMKGSAPHFCLTFNRVFSIASPRPYLP